MSVRARLSILLAGLGLLSLTLLPLSSRASHPAPPLAHRAHNHRWPAPAGSHVAVAAAVAAPAVCGVTGGTWTDRAVYPLTIDGTAVVALGGLLYSFGGFDGTANVTMAYKYDPVANSWTAIASLPAPRAGLSAVSDGSAIYLLNGYGATVGVPVAGLWRYSPGTNSYDTTLAAPTVDTGDQGAAYVGGQIYRLGGYSGSLGTDTPTVEVYTLSNNNWTTTSAYPFAVDGLAAVVLNGAIYTAGGYDAGAGAATVKTYRYLPAAPGWSDTAIADLPGVRAYAAAGVLDGQFMVAGGDALGAPFTSATAWNPATDNWAALPPLAQARDLTAGAALGSDFYVVGGDDALQQPTNSNERYSITPCATATVTVTPDVTATASRTASPTLTGTVTPTRTATTTASATATRSASATITASPVPDVTPSPLPDVTVTATSTAPPSATASHTPNPTAAPSTTATATGVPPTATRTVPPTGTATPTVPAPTRTATQPPPVTATPTLAAPTVPPSRTSTPLPTSTLPPTRTPTPTACVIRFSDVPYNDPTVYYAVPVYYLACHGVISGYSDGTFKPFMDTTRAQMTKIVTLAFTIPLVSPPAVGTFADVAGTDVFYQLIETAVARRIVSGYTCGGTNPQTGLNEPCTAGNRPYFRPSNFVTRGQLAKIVAMGAGWSLHTPARPTFSDVPTGAVFYGFIETAVCHGVISGYDDHTFRPANNATRGQIAKIAYLALNDSSGCTLAH